MSTEKDSAASTSMPIDARALATDVQPSSSPAKSESADEDGDEDAVAAGKYACQPAPCAGPDTQAAVKDVSTASSPPVEAAEEPREPQHSLSEARKAKIPRWLLLPAGLSVIAIVARLLLVMLRRRR